MTILRQTIEVFSTKLGIFHLKIVILRLATVIFHLRMENFF